MQRDTKETGAGSTVETAEDAVSDAAEDAGGAAKTAGAMRRRRTGSDAVETAGGAAARIQRKAEISSESEAKPRPFSGPSGHRAVGKSYEEKAAALLEEAGYRILDRNFTCRQGELDLVAADGETLCFIEVKYRSSLRGGYPQEAVTPAKRKHLFRAAAAWIAKYGRRGCRTFRFDVVGFTKDQHWLIQNAFGGL